MSFSYATTLINGMLIDANEVQPMFEVVRDYVNNCIHKDGSAEGAGTMNADLVFQYLNPAIVFKSTEANVHNMRIVADAYESAGALIIQSDIADDGTYENDILALPNDISDFLSLYPPVKAHSDVTIDKVDPTFNFYYATDNILQLMVESSTNTLKLRRSVDDGVNWVDFIDIDSSARTVKLGDTTNSVDLEVHGNTDITGNLNANNLSLTGGFNVRIDQLNVKIHSGAFGDDIYPDVGKRVVLDGLTLINNDPTKNTIFLLARLDIVIPDPYYVQDFTGWLRHRVNVDNNKNKVLVPYLYYYAGGGRAMGNYLYGDYRNGTVYYTIIEFPCA